MRPLNTIAQKMDGGVHSSEMAMAESDGGRYASYCPPSKRETLGDNEVVPNTRSCVQVKVEVDADHSRESPMALAIGTDANGQPQRTKEGANTPVDSKDAVKVEGEGNAGAHGEDLQKAEGGKDRLKGGEISETMSSFKEVNGGTRQMPANGLPKGTLNAPTIKPCLQCSPGACASLSPLQHMTAGLNQSDFSVKYAQLLGSELHRQYENPMFASDLVQKSIQPTGLPKRAPLPPKKGRRGPMNSSSQYRGVTFYRRTQRWEAHVWRSGKQVYLGGFRDEEAAARVYDKAVMKLRGSEADTNFDPAEYIEEMKELEAEECTPEEFILKLRRESKKQNRLRKEMDNGHHLHELKRSRYLEKTLARTRIGAETYAGLFQNASALAALPYGNLLPVTQSNAMPFLSNAYVGGQVPLANSCGLKQLGMIQAQQNALKNLNTMMAQNYPMSTGLSLPLQANQVQNTAFPNPGAFNPHGQVHMMQSMFQDNVQSPQSILQSIQNQALLQAMAKVPTIATTANLNFDQMKDIISKQLNL